MKKLVLTLILSATVLSGVFAQVESGDTEVTANQRLKEISINKMEDSGLWYAVMPSDNGLISLRTFPGAPDSKEPLEDEQQFGLGVADVNVIGAKVDFYHRGIMDFAVMSSKPIPIEGITKTVSVWVAGRNTEHRLELIISDSSGTITILPMGKLNFSGWKQLTVTIPSHIKQQDYHYQDRPGVMIKGFNIKCNLDETYGRYYVYFDDIRAVTDLYTEENRDVDDIPDTW
ncbi:MAG: hypothetical protein B0D92_08785 [Spirochaeta sp. LUC14_002_19_P3]|nr:MAG: hypothetical protein B0D92_08785 [Spirochaeta sp. LUC14_002_19_P3]